MSNYMLSLGESALHMAIANENQAMVHFLCKHGADIHERAYGAFFCPEDQRKSRRDHPVQEGIVLSDETNYERWEKNETVMDVNCVMEVM